MKIETMKTKVKLWRINNNVKYANLLARAIVGYEKSRCTKTRLDNYYRQLEVLIFKG